MCGTSKRQTEQHLIDREGQRLLQSVLPRHWVLHVYKPDFGIDYSLEVFSAGQAGPRTTAYETLGEHLFIQLKSTTRLEVKPYSIYASHGTEIPLIRAKERVLQGQINTARFQLETSELVTVDRMGAGVPVLLIIADIHSSKCYFVCLNDYIDKILSTRANAYRSQGSSVIHVPTLNEILPSGSSSSPLAWYAKRPKLFAAFQRFYYQQHELIYAFDGSDAQRAQSLAQHFARQIAAYDFWGEMSNWPIFSYVYNGLVGYASNGVTGWNQNDSSALARMLGFLDLEDQVDVASHFAKVEALQLWNNLCLLSRNYEEIWREKYLPTSIGLATSYESCKLATAGEKLDSSLPQESCNISSTHAIPEINAT